MLYQGQTYTFEIVGGDGYVAYRFHLGIFSLVQLSAGPCILRGNLNRSLRTPFPKIQSFSKSRRLTNGIRDAFICPARRLVYFMSVPVYWLPNVVPESDVFTVTLTIDFQTTHQVGLKLQVVRQKRWNIMSPVKYDVPYRQLKASLLKLQAVSFRTTKGGYAARLPRQGEGGWWWRGWCCCCRRNGSRPMDWPSQTLLGPAARLHLALFRFLPARVANLPCIQLLFRHTYYWTRQIVSLLFVC